MRAGPPLLFSVVYEQSEGRGKVLKTIKDPRLTWVHYFVGKGVFFGAGIRANKLGREAKRLRVIEWSDSAGLRARTRTGALAG